MRLGPGDIVIRAATSSLLYPDDNSNHNILPTMAHTKTCSKTSCHDYTTSSILAVVVVVVVVVVVLLLAGNTAHSDPFAEISL